MHKLEDLNIWHKAMLVTEQVYELSASFPKEEKFGLTSQIRRCAVSVPSNIAEGAGRNTKGEFANFLGIANGSLYELQTQLLLASRLDFVSKNIVNRIIELVIEIQRMNYGLIKTLKKI